MEATVATVPAVEQKPSYTGLLLPIALMGLAIVLYYSLDTKAAIPGFTPVRFATLGLILFGAGLVSGMAGFAFSAIAGLSLLLLPAAVIVPVLQGCSTFNQALSISKLRQDMPKTLGEWFPNGPGPAIIGGLLGVQVGVWALNNLPGPVLMLILGGLITLYSLYSTFKPKGLVIHGYDGPVTGAVVGWLGGAIGGFTAFPGLPVVLWTGLRDVTKAKSRAIVQPFIITLQVAAIVTNAIHHPANFGKSYWIMLALGVPAVLPGTLTGVWIYRQLSEVNFKRVTFTLLLVSGMGLVVKALSALL